MKMFLVILILSLASMVIPNSFAQPQCDYRVEIIANGSEFLANEFKWRMRASKIDGTPTNITGTAKIEDASGNIIKKYSPWTGEPISKQKTSGEYSPNLKEGQYKIISEINVECDDINKNNNIDAKTITIKSGAKINNNQITNAPAESAPNTNLNPAENKNQSDEINIADTKSAQNITVEQNKTETSNNSIPKGQTDANESDNIIYSSQANSQKNENTIPTSNAAKESNLIYESSSEKSKNTIVYFILGLSVLLNIVLIWKR